MQSTTNASIPKGRMYFDFLADVSIHPTKRKMIVVNSIMCVNKCRGYKILRDSNSNIDARITVSPKTVAQVLNFRFILITS